jgi:hypothetical protein
MILYHGSNQTIKEPSLQYSRSSLDFGAGFYLTSDIEQAQKWAKRVTHIREKGEPVVSVYETNDMIWQTLSILRLEHADKEWLRLVVAYRTNHPIDSKYDIITGPVADDRTVDVINQYISGAYPEDIALQLLLPLKFKDQWTMKTERAISALIWKEAIQV